MDSVLYGIVWQTRYLFRLMGPNTRITCWRIVENFSDADPACLYVIDINKFSGDTP
jgi:hypothetical protein